MAQQPNQPRQIAWVVDFDLANAEQVLDLARELKGDTAIGSPGNVIVNLNGSPLGVNFKGDPDEVANDLSSLTDRRFVAANFQAQFPQADNLQLNFALNFALRQLTLNIQNAKPKLSDKLFSLVQTRFPRVPAPTTEEAESLSLQLVGLVREAEKASETSEEATKALKSIKKRDARSSELVSQIEDKAKHAQSVAEEAHKYQEKTAGHAAEIGNAKAQVQADQETVRASRENVGGIEAQVRQFFEEIADNREKISESERVSRQTVETSTTETSKILSENQELQKEIREHLQKAIGASLFSAFQGRKEQIANSKWVWAALTILAIVAQAGVFIWLAQTAQEVASNQAFYQRPAFLLRALASIPIIFFIGYAIRQYARERDFEELYSFKSALSFSLAPYLDLVKDLSERPETEQYRDFVVKSIGQIFENPLGQDMDRPRGKRRDDVMAKDILDRVIDLVEKSGKR